MKAEFGKFEVISALKADDSRKMAGRPNPYRGGQAVDSSAAEDSFRIAALTRRLNNSPH
jgi:hypothetical protein